MLQPFASVTRVTSPRIIMCQKADSGKRCKEGDAPGAGRELTPEQWITADTARARAMSVLGDVLKKKDQLLMEAPQWMVSRAPDAKGPEQVWMNRYAVLTEERVTHLKSVMRIIQLKEDSRERFSPTYAYVYAGDESRTVYLCPMFWEAPELLQRNSQPGILIHEVSHFCGAKDLGYGSDARSMSFCCHGRGIRRQSSSLAEPSAEIEQVIENADNIEYEFEMTLNHKGKYMDNSYTCCRERNQDSVCINSVSSDFLSYHDNKRENAINIKKVAEEMIRQSDTLEKLLKQLHEKADFFSVNPDKGDMLRMLSSMNLEHLGAIKECVEEIVALSRRVLEALHEFHDFKWPEGETFGQGLHSLAEHILGHTLYSEARIYTF
ncbi:hypothetical protein NDU88_000391 [Pleurodeles waltl]|uniref:Lysine-specific metallo-endopeptidase domain-containing protein n=1 Tax=Pleurodeles waltl TaxID=8319 RepID=A0AAV7U3U5_PLEWA|nr:hypothetical protein NDU88_000391 [Pleurodeles waltl]